MSLTQIIVPVYNEGENIRVLVKRLNDANISFDLLKFIYDYDQDPTLSVIRQLEALDSRIKGEKNEFGRGVLNALRWGFSRVEPGAVIVVMGDNSDRLEVIPEMVKLWSKGAVIVSPSRYMKGGKQNGGGVLKRALSRLAGTSLYLFGFPTSDPTNNFKLYDAVWLKAQRIESKGGFELALELCVKAFSQNRVISQLPTIWEDRTLGQSNFQLFKWLPHYLYWYLSGVKAIIVNRFFS